IGAYFESVRTDSTHNLTARQTFKVLNLKGDIAASVSEEGQLQIYSYDTDAAENKTQMTWSMYQAALDGGFEECRFDASWAPDADWVLFADKVLQAGARDYDHPSEALRAEADTARREALKELLSLDEVMIAVSTQRTNSGGETVRTMDAGGIVQETVYERYGEGAWEGLPSARVARNLADGSLVREELNIYGEVSRRELSGGLVQEYTYDRSSYGRILATHERTYYSHDPSGPGSLESRYFNAEGDLERVIDKNGIERTYEYFKQADGGVRTVIGTAFQADEGSEVSYQETRITDASGRQVFFEDKNGKIVRTRYVLGADGSVVQSEETTEWVSAEGTTVSFIQSYGFNALGEQIWAVDKNGDRFEFEYAKDEFGNLSEVRQFQIMSSGARALTTKRYSAAGDLIAQTDKNDRTVAFTYSKDANGNVIGMTETQKLRSDLKADQKLDDGDLAVLQAIIAGELEAADYPGADVNRDGVVDTHDASALTASAEYGTYETHSTKTFNVWGDVITVTDKNDLTMTTSYCRDAKGNVTSTVETNSRYAGETTRYFDKDAKVIGMFDQSGNQVTYRYTLDEKGNALQTVEEQTLLPPAKEKTGGYTYETIQNEDGTRIERRFTAAGLLNLETHYDQQGRITYQKAGASTTGNLAPSALVTVCSEYDQSYRSEFMTDGLNADGHYWRSAGNVDGTRDEEYVLLDLNEVHEVSQVKVYGSQYGQDVSSFLRGYLVSVSEDGIHWTRAGEIAGEVTGGRLDKIMFNPIDARYVKIHGFVASTGNGGSVTPYYAQIAEVEVYATIPARETWYSYEERTDESGRPVNVVTQTDANGDLVQEEIFDEQGRTIYLKKKSGSTYREYVTEYTTETDPELGDLEVMTRTDGDGNLEYQEKKDSQGRMVYIYDFYGGSSPYQYSGGCVLRYTDEPEGSLTLTVTKENTEELLYVETTDALGRVTHLFDSTKDDGPVDYTYATEIGPNGVECIRQTDRYQEGGYIRETLIDPNGRTIYTKLDYYGDGSDILEVWLEDIYDFRGEVIRTDQHSVRNGVESLVKLGFSMPDDQASIDLSCTIPIVRVHSSSGVNAENLIDGQFGLSNDTQYAQTDINGIFTFELEKPMAIGRFEAYFRSDDSATAPVTMFTIQASLDGMNWFNVAASRYLAQGRKFISFDPVLAQFIRVQGAVGSGNPTVFQMEEFRVYPPAGWPVTSTITRSFNTRGDLLSEYQEGGVRTSYEYERDEIGNVTGIIETHHGDGRRVEISKAQQIDISNGSVTDYDRRIIDQDRATYDTIASTTRYPNLVTQFELNEETVINEVRLLWDDTSDSYGYYCQIEISADGQTWQTVYDNKTQRDRSWNRIQFEAASARYLRLRGYDPLSTGSNLRIREFSVYSEVPSSTEYTTYKSFLTPTHPQDETRGAEASGGIAVDPSEGRFGSSVYFDGVDDHLSYPDSDVLTVEAGQDFTIDFWCRPSNLNTAQQVLLTTLDVSYGDRYGLPADGLGIYTSYKNIAVEGPFHNNNWEFGFNTAGDLLREGEWNHIALVRHNGELRIYINGSAASMNQTWGGGNHYNGALKPTLPLVIGDNQDMATNYRYQGHIDDIRITKGDALWWSNFDAAALPAAEVQGAKTSLLLDFDWRDGGRQFRNRVGERFYYSGEGTVTTTTDRSGSLIRHAYSYDEKGNRTGHFQALQMKGNYSDYIEYSGE
ncbi:MAG: discoidin domain-containing protein, partial [Candidatus Omnitrophica bacterium]|nr:discoidin domain-containing protein [Candidatus Omnitrophota bacterium]